MRAPAHEPCRPNAARANHQGVPEFGEEHTVQRHRLGLVVWLGLALAPLPSAAQQPYKLLKTIDLPGDKGGHGDWVIFDRDTGTVWLAQTPDHNVVVLDTKTLTVRHVIADIENGNNIALTPDYAFLAENTSNVIIVVDKRSFAPIARLHPQDKGTTRSVFDAKEGVLLVTTDTGEAIVIAATPPFATRSHTRLQPDPAKDGPDVGLYAPSLGRFYQPVDNVVDVIDPASGAVLAVWSPGVKGRVKPMVYDAKTGHFLAGTTDRKMLVLDKEGSLVTSIPVAGAVDETTIDEGLRRAYVGDKAGGIEVIDLDQNTVVATLPSEPDVHTLAVDTASHRIFVYRNASNKVDVFEPAIGP